MNDLFYSKVCEERTPGKMWLVRVGCIYHCVGLFQLFSSVILCQIAFLLESKVRLPLTNQLDSVDGHLAKGQKVIFWCAPQADHAKQNAKR